MSVSKKTGLPKIIICFRRLNKTTGTKETKAFHVGVTKDGKPKTRNVPPCKKSMDKFFTKKQQRPNLVKSALEREICRKVKSKRIPKVYEVNDKDGIILMEHTGLTLDKLSFPRNTGGLKSFITHHKSDFISDITIALTDLISIGYIHKDLAARNITYKKNHFYIIDFDVMDKVESYEKRHGLSPDPEHIATKLYEKLTSRHS